MTDKTTQPLPCPFCGGEPRIMERPQSGKDTGFFCSISCFCGKYSTRAHQHGIAETVEAARAEALTAWNTRAVNSHHDLIEALTDVGASLAAAISLLERGGKAAKKAAPSDRMFDQMVKDYKASLNRTRAILTKEAGQ